VACLPL